MYVFYKIGVLKNFAKFTRAHRKFLRISVFVHLFCFVHPFEFDNRQLLTDFLATKNLLLKAKTIVFLPCPS